jgi:hypothetical protein
MLVFALVVAGSPPLDLSIITITEANGTFWQPDTHSRPGDKHIRGRLLGLLISKINTDVCVCVLPRGGWKGTGCRQLWLRPPSSTVLRRTIYCLRSAIEQFHLKLPHT